MTDKTFHLGEKIAKLEEIEAFFQKSDLDIEAAIIKQKEAQVLAKEILAYLQKAETSLKEIENIHE